MNPLRCLVLLVLLASPFAVQAHSVLHASTPADGAVLAQAPQALQLEFGAAVRLLALRISDAGGTPVEVELPAATQAAQTFSVPLPVLPAQHYTVEWTVMGADTHRVAGKFAFDIGPAAP